MIASVGVMLQTGGNALISFHLGLDEKKKANEYFYDIMFLLYRQYLEKMNKI